MEYVLQLITINLNEEFLPENRIINQEPYPYVICDIYLPQRNTGYVYMLVSLKYFNYSCIGKNSQVRRRILQHNYGLGYTSTETMHLLPFDIFAYICGTEVSYLLFLLIFDIWMMLLVVTMKIKFLININQKTKINCLNLFQNSREELFLNPMTVIFKPISSLGVLS